MCFSYVKPRPVGAGVGLNVGFQRLEDDAYEASFKATEGFSLGVSGQQAFAVVAAAFAIEMGLGDRVRWRAQFNCRLPARDMRTRPAVLPDQTGIGATPAWRA